MKLLICDDDISTLDVIESQLDCRALGIDAVLRAYNGEAAIRTIDRERPELILCDIEMPKVTGMEVLKYIYEHGIYAEFAFLTCFDEFEYARGALRYGAANYLVKPIDFEELGGALQRMTAAVKAHREEQDSQEFLDTKVNNLLRQIHDGFYGTNRERIDSVISRNRLKSINAGTPVRLILTEAETTENYEIGWERELLAYSYSRLAEEVLTGYIGYSSTIVNVGERYMSTTTFVWAEKQTEEESLENVRKLLRLCSVHFTMVPVCLISDTAPLYETARVAAELREQSRKVILQAGSIYFLRDVKDITGVPADSIDETKMLRLIKYKDKEGCLRMISDAVEKISRGRGDNGSMMFLLHQDIFQVFLNFLRDNNIPVRVLFQNEELRALDGRANRSTLDMLNYVSFLYDYVQEAIGRRNDENDIIGNVKRFIMAHYKENINRETVSAVAYITPNYLSKRFRAEMGMSLREYINQLRVEEAKRLLLSTNATVSEVASEVGYDNISYFSTVFKKQCGMSPIEWCAGRRNEEDKNEVD